MSNETNRKKEKQLFGIKPNGHMHLGHYTCIKDAIHNSNCFFLVADIHARSSIEKLSGSALETILELVSLGVKIENIILQSSIPYIFEIFYLVQSFFTLGQLQRMHLFKSKKNKGVMFLSEFVYPALMFVDIMLCDADTIVVGKDQRQHIELYNDIANKLTKSGIDTRQVKMLQYDCIPGIDGRKMSKSYLNTISFCDTLGEIEKKVFSIKTDSMAINETKDRNNLFDICSVVYTDKETKELSERFSKRGLSYLEEKQKLALCIISQAKCFKENMKENSKEKDILIDKVHNNTLKMKNKCLKILNDIRSKMATTQKMH